MAVAGSNSAKSGMTTGAMLAAAVCLLALPSAVLAFSTSFEPPVIRSAPEKALDQLEAGAGAKLASAIPVRSLAKGQLYPFTPARTANRPDRSVTVAVRVDPITVLGVVGRKLEKPSDAGAAAAALRISPNAFALGVSRGYHNFTQELVPPETRKVDMPDLRHFSLAPTASSGGSRLIPRIIVDEKQAAGRTPRTFAGDGDDQVDVGGSYRLTRNINVTAGVRYSQDRERLRPLTDGKQDNQAVYLGTQFRF